MIDIKHNDIKKDPITKNTWNSSVLATAKGDLFSIEFSVEYSEDINELVLFDEYHQKRYVLKAEEEYDPDIVAEFAKILHSSEAAVKVMIDEIFVLMINH